MRKHKLQEKNAASLRESEKKLELKGPTFTM